MTGINERQSKIIERLNKKGFVKVSELCEKLDVSTVTIRKDLSFLEEKGLLHRTHGGASKQSLYAFERNVGEKEGIQVEEKRKIAQQALRYIQDGDHLILSSGTTVLYLSRMLSTLKKLTVLTSSLSVATELSEQPTVDVIQLGGSVRKSSNSVVGPLAEKTLQDFSCNTLFLGVDGIDPEFGLTTTNIDEAQLNKAMIKSAEKVIVLTDSSKIGKRSFGKIAGLDQVDVLITDKDLAADSKVALEDAGVEVCVV
ncbi:aga operon transcriptional regulator AgaR [Gangjinia marincola]|uniref:Aga operon transcriptional regulator AgaR n=1 Tax=Gangjinia marincola TaxID=578463 RepID=A0ABP3XWT1_9FLAO